MFQQNYNRAHARTRVLIEQSFGVLKRRFSVLQSGCRVDSPERAAKYVTACAVLHNIGREIHVLLQMQKLAKINDSFITQKECHQYNIITITICVFVMSLSS